MTKYRYAQINPVLKQFIEKKKIDVRFASTRILTQIYSTCTSRLEQTEGLFLWEDQGHGAKKIYVGSDHSDYFHTDGIVAHELTHWLQSEHLSPLIYKSRPYELEYEADTVAILIGKQLGFAHKYQEWLSAIYFGDKLEAMHQTAKRYAHEMLNAA